MGQYELAKAAWTDERATLLERVRHLNEELLPELTQSKMEVMRAKSEALSALSDMCQAKEHAEWHGPGVIAAQKASTSPTEAMPQIRFLPLTLPMVLTLTLAQTTTEMREETIP